jgi:hypothetical protein
MHAKLCGTLRRPAGGEGAERPCARMPGAPCVRDAYRTGFQAGWLSGLQDPARLAARVAEAERLVAKARDGDPELHEAAAGYLHALLILQHVKTRQGSMGVL